LDLETRDELDPILSNLGIQQQQQYQQQKKKKPAERVQKSHLRVVHELGVAVAGGDCHVVKVVVSKSPSFFVGENWPKKKTNAKKDPHQKNGKTLNPKRRALLKREKERGQESSLKQYKKKKGVVRGMVRREYTLKIYSSSGSSSTGACGGGGVRRSRGGFSRLSFTLLLLL